MFEPKATAPHLDSTATTFVIAHSPPRFSRRDGRGSSGKCRASGGAYLIIFVGDTASKSDKARLMDSIAV
jgi:hypothetical protein